MILETMNDDERCYEAFRMTTVLYNLYKDVMPQIRERFNRGTRFPYFQRYAMNDDKNNRWIVMAYCLSKADRKKGRYFFVSYMTYDIPRKRKENDTRAGKGILMFDPVAMEMKLNHQTERAVGVYDITPHAINRYTERYLRPKGMEDMEFHKKIESILIRWQHFDIAADICGDKNASKHTDDGICPYDVVMRGGGMLRGIVVNCVYIRLNTYVSDDMLFENQKERQDELVKEYHDWKRRGIIKDF